MKKIITNIKQMFVSVVLSLGFSSLVCVDKKSHKDQNIRATLTYQDFKNNRFSRFKKALKKTKNEHLMELRQDASGPFGNTLFSVMSMNNITTVNGSESFLMDTNEEKQEESKVQSISIHDQRIQEIKRVIQMCINKNQQVVMNLGFDMSNFLQEYVYLAEITDLVATQIYLKDKGMKCVMGKIQESWSTKLSESQKSFFNDLIRYGVQAVKKLYQV